MLSFSKRKRVVYAFDEKAKFCLAARLINNRLQIYRDDQREVNKPCLMVRSTSLALKEKLTADVRPLRCSASKLARKFRIFEYCSC